MDGLEATNAEYNDKYLLVVAIDFGTSYSGYAYSLRTDFQKDPCKVFAKQAWNAGPAGLLSAKTPTCLLLDEEKNFVAFGYDAENKYAELLSENKQGRYYFFERFKMKLYESFLYEDIFADLLEAVTLLCQALLNIVELQSGKPASKLPNIVRPDMTVMELGGKTLPAADIFSLSIKALMDDLLSHLEEKGHTLITLQDIKWVLTVPAIWSSRAKRFMRKSAIQAGIPDENLTIALEPECASVFCQHIPSEQMTGTDSVFSAGNIGTKYMVIDLGGGTADIAVHEKLEGQKLKELCRTEGGDCGGTSVDKAFQSLLEKVFGLEVMTDMQKTDQESYLLISRSFETAKRKVLPQSAGKFAVHLPYVSLENLCQKHHKKNVEDVVKIGQLADKITIRNGHLKIDVSVFKGLFQPTLDKLIHVLKKVFENERVKGVENIVLVGGFAECKLVQERIKDSFPFKRLIVPEDSGLAVLKGAVMFGHLPSYISVRVIPFTYGILVSKPFDELVHDKGRAFVQNGTMYCKNLFEKIIERDTEVVVGSKIIKEFSTSVPFQTIIRLRIYSSTSKNPRYIDDEDCSFVGLVKLKVPRPTQCKQSLRVLFDFGDSEISSELEDKSSGDKYEGIIEDETDSESSENIPSIPDIIV